MRGTIKISDAIGREIETLANGVQEAENCSVVFNSKNLASGMSFKAATLTADRDTPSAYIITRCAAEVFSNKEATVMK